MSLKILASDYDGTLFFHDENPPYRINDLEKIAEFQKQGNLFGMCTGRPLNGILPFIPGNLQLDFYILNSGAVVLNKDKEEIFKKAIPFETLKEMMARFPDFAYFIMTEDKMYVREFKEDMTANDNLRLFKTADDLANHEILGISFHIDDENEIPDILASLAHFETLSVYQNRNDIDCVASNCSKGSGIKALQKHYGLTDQQVACIGDSFNDLPMLESVENSFTFHASPEAVKAKAKYLVNSLAQCLTFLMNDEEQS